MRLPANAIEIVLSVLFNFAKHQIIYDLYMLKKDQLLNISEMIYSLQQQLNHLLVNTCVHHLHHLQSEVIFLMTSYGQCQILSVNTKCSKDTQQKPRPNPPLDTSQDNRELKAQRICGALWPIAAHLMSFKILKIIIIKMLLVVCRSLSNISSE